MSGEADHRLPSERNAACAAACSRACQPLQCLFLFTVLRAVFFFFFFFFFVLVCVYLAILMCVYCLLFLSSQVKPLIWIESVIERHSHSRVEYMIKVQCVLGSGKDFRRWKCI